MGAGEEPPNGPIIYDLLPADGAVIPQDELKPVRAGATIETRHDTGIESVEIFIDGKRAKKVALLGPYRYLQSATVDLKGLKPGEHEIRVVATDFQGRTGGHTWSFTVAPADSTAYSRVVDNSDKVTTGRFDASTGLGLQLLEPRTLRYRLPLRPPEQGRERHRELPLRHPGPRHLHRLWLVAKR